MSEVAVSPGSTTHPGPPDGRILSLIRFVVTALAVVFALALIVLVIDFLLSDQLMLLDLGGLPEGAMIELPAGASIFEANFLVDVEAGFGYRALWGAVTILPMVPLIAFLLLFRRVIAKGSEPFTPENAARLRWMAIIALGFGVFGVLRPLVVLALQNALGFDEFRPPWPDFTDLLVALFIGGLLEIWRHGIVLKAEQDLTV